MFSNSDGWYTNDGRGKSGLTGLLTHQGALCGKSVKQNKVFKLMIKVINIIRDGNRAFSHRQLKQPLEEMKA